MMHSPRSRAPVFFRLALVLTLALSGAPASAQLRLPVPSLSLPQRIGPLDNDFTRRPGRLLDDTRVLDLAELRPRALRQLLLKNPQWVEADPRGAPVVRREILAWSPTPAALDAAQRLGARVLREQQLEGLGERVVTLAVPEAMETATLLERLRALDPEGEYDFNHLYQGAGAVEAPARAGDMGASHPVGLVDGGVDAAHPVFADARIRRWGCAGADHPDAHGTSVAALLIGRSAHFAGVAPRAPLYAADIYCGNPAGGAAATIAGALDWLAREHVAVINLSIVGPPNRTLERSVAALVKRGHVLVAAVGNDGPAAPPLYPASYPGVVGVTGVDRRGQVLPEAARGDQVMFAAPGSDMASAVPGEPPYRRVRGTSFAAPIVAALLARRLGRPDVGEARAAIADLARLAGGVRNPETGYGVVGMDQRIDPATLRGR